MPANLFHKQMLNSGRRDTLNCFSKETNNLYRIKHTQKKESKNNEIFRKDIATFYKEVYNQKKDRQLLVILVGKKTETENFGTTVSIFRLFEKCKTIILKKLTVKLFLV